MMKHLLLFLAMLLSCVTACPAASTAPPWLETRYLAGGGYWSLRVPVTVENPGEAPAAGEPVTVSVAALAGQSGKSLRACNVAAQELLFDVRDRSGSPKRSDTLAADDRITIPVECAAKSSATVYLYAGNDAAWTVPEFLAGGFVNGGFESGYDKPAGWSAGGTDEHHRATWERTGGRSRRCVKVEVDAGAEPTWVQWSQHNIPVKPGCSYKVSAWVRGENVVGRAGWFVHVNGDKPQLINKTIGVGEGTFGWKEVSVTFTAPPMATTATIGTLLHGTGRAWFDDAMFEEVDGGNRLRVSVGSVERLSLAKAERKKLECSRQWPCCAIVRVFNLADQPVSGALVHADLSPAMAKLRSVPTNAVLRIVDTATGEVAANCVRRGGTVMFDAALPAKSEREFAIYFSATQREATNAFTSAYGRLLSSPLNLATNGSFESGADLPEGWEATNKGGSLGADAMFGKRSAAFTLLPDAKSTWVGWRSQLIPVQAGASYFYGGFLKGKGLSGSATLHAHQLGRDGKIVGSGGYVSTQPAVGSDAGWTFSSTVIHAPPDAATIQLHLTTNARVAPPQGGVVLSDTTTLQSHMTAGGRGTLQHDGVLLCRVVAGEVVGFESGETDGGHRPPLQVWEVNPLVKVFRDSLPGRMAKSVAMECARNEYEPFQLVLRSEAGLGCAEVAVSPLKNNRGATLPAVKVERVGYVPIDWPSGYFQTDVPAWHRRVPRGHGSTDGWADWWPDPLEPNAPFYALENQAQPFWFTVCVPQDAAPGEYRGTVSIRDWDQVLATVAVRVKVLPFALPERTRLKAIFDFRSGPGGEMGAGIKTPEGQRRWLRFMAEHRLGTDHIPAQPKFEYKDGRVTMDATEFDVMARYCFDELGMNVSYTPPFFYAFGGAYPPKKLFGLEPFTPAYNDALKQAYRLFTSHLKEKGWHDKFIYYISDEPHFDHPFVIEQMKKLCALLHEVDPAIPIYSSTWRHCPAWDDALDLWGVGQYGCFPVPEMERL
ncbi:MAG: carbohydrate binding domain-containing protein, partial [Verrucomicrobia bacterium]|nr:carbohydrate binding domain-containing protein [Verrucomicrobiota bacterium]